MKKQMLGRLLLGLISIILASCSGGVQNTLSTAATTDATVYFYTGTNGWDKTDIVYQLDGTWTGAAMEAACTDWVRKTVALGVAASIPAAFNNGTDWDNNGGANYTIPGGITTLRDGVLKTDAASPCEDNPNPPELDTGFTLGVMYSPDASTFSVWSPDSADVVLNLNGRGYPMSKIADTNGYTDVYSVTLEGDHNLEPYNFQIGGQTSRDPYGVMVQAGTDNNIVLDLAQTVLPGGWSPTPPLKNRVDSVIYEVHVRDFTVDASSGVPTAQRGTYAGMTRTGTTVNGSANSLKTGIDHLVDMGVTHVQLLPVFDFGPCSPAQVAANPDCYNWGYAPVNYNVPEERYSQTPNDYEGRVREFKAMVDAFHQRGIRVVMDVVHNHTFSKDDLGKITQKYYNDVDLSGTGNSLDETEPMVARFIQDSLEYWVREYNLDGFRFDLMGVFDTDVVGEWGHYLNETFPERNLLIYGEPWTGAEDSEQRQHVRFGTVGTIADAHVGVFNGAFRDALKNSKNREGGTGGFIFNQGTEDSSFGAFDPSETWSDGLGRGAISVGVKGSPLKELPATVLPNVWDAMFTAAPEQSVNYADVHDDLNLADKVAAWAEDNGQTGNPAYLGRIQEFALGTVLTSQGVPLLHGGSEMRRTKQGDANSFESPDRINRFDWNLLSENASTYNYVKKVIAIRKAHPGFRFTTWPGVDKSVKSDQRSASLVYTLIDSAANGDTWNQTLVILNSGSDEIVTLPPGSWNVALENSSPAGGERSVSGSVMAAGTAVTILYQ